MILLFRKTNTLVGIGGFIEGGVVWVTDDDGK